MVHDDRTYLDDEGLEYSSRKLEREEEAEETSPTRLGAGGPLWGADEAYGGYDAE
jgi:hypothetical protein